MAFIREQESQINTRKRVCGEQIRRDHNHGRPKRGAAAGDYAARAERITAEDPTSRAIWLRKAEHDARRKTLFARAPRRWHV